MESSTTILHNKRLINVTSRLCYAVKYFQDGEWFTENMLGTYQDACDFIDGVSTHTFELYEVLLDGTWKQLSP